MLKNTALMIYLLVGLTEFNNIYQHSIPCNSMGPSETSVETCRLMTSSVKAAMWPISYANEYFDDLT